MNGEAAIMLRDGVYMAARKRFRPKTELPVKIEEYVSRVWGLSADCARHVHGVHPVHPDRSKSVLAQLMAKMMRARGRHAKG